jgi:hypothetical protein
VTQGAVPVRVYDAWEVEGAAGCLLPPTETLYESDQQITIQDYIDGTVPFGGSSLDCDLVCGPDGTGACSFDLDVTIPASGQAYVNVHLNYGLKGVDLDANICEDLVLDRYDRGSPDVFGGWNALENTGTNDGGIALSTCKSYAFSHVDGYGATFQDNVESVNEFKRIAGAFGLVSSSDSESGSPGTETYLRRNSTGQNVQIGTTDADGFYGLPYKHVGKPAFYTVVLPNLGLTHKIRLKGNGRAEVNFDPITGTSTGTFTAGGGGCTPTENPEFSCNDGVDNDCDALVDDFDPDCEGNGGGCTPTENSEFSCSDGVDNDCDGLADDLDPDCQGGTCSAGLRGDSCSVHSDCCSNRCKGKRDHKICK